MPRTAQFVADHRSEACGCRAIASAVLDGPDRPSLAVNKGPVRVPGQSGKHVRHLRREVGPTLGLLGNRARESKLARCRQLLDAPPSPVLAMLDDPHDRYEALTGRPLHICPVCAVGIMQRIDIIPATVGRARPAF